jgi:hypothetical protein
VTNRHPIQPKTEFTTADGLHRTVLDLEEQIAAGGGGGGGAYTGITGVPTGTIFYRKTAGTGAAETQLLATLKTDLGLTGTNSGDQTNITGNAGTATALQTARNINGVAFDGTGNITINAVDSTARLAASAVSAFGLTLIDDADAAAARATLGAQVAGSYLTGNQSITLSGDVSGSGATAITVTLATVNSNTGTFGGAATVPQISVNGKGLITGVTAVAIAAPWGGLTSVPAAVSALTGTNTGDETKTTIDTKIGATGGSDFYRKDGTWATPSSSGDPAPVHMAADAAARGAAIADYFASTLSLDASSTYEIECHVHFLKTTAGTVIWTWLFSNAPGMVTSRYEMTPITGYSGAVVTGAPLQAQATGKGVATIAHAASGSLTTAVDHSFVFWVRIRTNLATTIQLRSTESAGTITPRAGSYMRARKIA